VTDGQTDRQTDGIAIAYTRYSYAAARNKRIAVIFASCQITDAQTQGNLDHKNQTDLDTVWLRNNNGTSFI